MTEHWTLIGQPPGNTPLIDGPSIPDGVEITVAPVQADDFAGHESCPHCFTIDPGDDYCGSCGERL